MPVIDNDSAMDKCNSEYATEVNVIVNQQGKLIEEETEDRSFTRPKTGENRNKNNRQSTIITNKLGHVR